MGKWNPGYWNVLGKYDVNKLHMPNLKHIFYFQANIKIFFLNQKQK